MNTRRPPPRVVMLVANHFLHDTRVYKEARSLIEWGCEVHVIALYDPELPMSEEVDGIRVRRVSMRRGDLWRLPAVVLSWWCRPILRRLLGPVGKSATTSPMARSTVPGSTKLQPSLAPASTTEIVSGPSSANNETVLDARAISQPDGSEGAVSSTRHAMLHFVVRFVRRPPLRMFGAARSLTVRLARRFVGWCKSLAPSSLRLLSMNLQFARHAIDLQPDVVQSHDLNALFGGALVKRLTGVGLVYDSHELFLKRNIGNKPRVRENLLWGPIERCCIGKCDAVLSVAEGICEYLAKQYDIPKPHLIRNVQPYEPPGVRTTLLADELGIPAHRWIVIYPGAITINRGLEVMIDSAPHLNEAAYVIMGYARNPQYLDSLKQRAETLGVMGSSVFFREAVEIEDVSRYVGSADLGIVPTQNVCLSYYFESSNKIFHCVMAGVPVAMSDHREKRSLVEEYGIGVLFNETDPAEIARVVNQALDDREAYAQMRRNCLEAARVLNWEHEEHTLRQIFTDLLGDRAAPIPRISIERVCEIQTQPPGRPHYVTAK